MFSLPFTFLGPRDPAASESRLTSRLSVNVRTKIIRQGTGSRTHQTARYPSWTVPVHCLGF